MSVRERFKPVAKWGDLKIFACPNSTITNRTWSILRLVNETTHPETTVITHLPFDGGLIDQPLWYREAVLIVREERNSHRIAEMKKIRKESPK